VAEEDERSCAGGLRRMLEEEELWWRRKARAIQARDRYWTRKIAGRKMLGKGDGRKRG